MYLGLMLNSKTIGKSSAWCHNDVKHDGATVSTPLYPLPPNLHHSLPSSCCIWKVTQHSGTSQVLYFHLVWWLPEQPQFAIFVVVFTHTQSSSLLLSLFSGKVLLVGTYTIVGCLGGDSHFSHLNFWRTAQKIKESERGSRIEGETNIKPFSTIWTGESWWKETSLDCLASQGSKVYQVVCTGAEKAWCEK